MKELKYKDNTTNSKKRIWDEYENERGDSTLQIHEPKKITQYDTCEHYYEYEDKQYSAVCKKCGLGKAIVFGLHFVKDGKIVDKL